MNAINLIISNNVFSGHMMFSLFPFTEIILNKIVN